MIKQVNRTALVFLLVFVVSVAIGLAGKHVGFGYYPQVALCFLAGLAITRLDRERFYGPR